MTAFLLFDCLVMFVFDAHSCKVYQCTDAVGRVNFDDRPCAGKSKEIKSKDDAGKREELTGLRFARPQVEFIPTCRALK